MRLRPYRLGKLTKGLKKLSQKKDIDRKLLKRYVVGFENRVAYVDKLIAQYEKIFAEELK